MATPTQKRRRGRLSLILGVVFAALTVGAVMAYGDTVNVNDLNTGGDTSAVRGGTGSAAAYLTDPTGSPPGDVNGCNAGQTPVTVTFSSSGATFASPGTVSLTGCGSATAQSLGYTMSAIAALGSQVTISGTASGGKAGSQFNSNPDSFLVRILPRPASNLAASANGATQVDLSWTASPDAADITDYKIYEGATEVSTAAKNVATKSITGLGSGSSHCYTIKARYNDGTNDYFSAAAGGSGAACATTASDSTPPVITKTITGTLGSNSWYTSSVTVEWGVDDPDSAVVIDSGCGTQTFSSDTANGTSSCAAHSAGGSASDSLSFKIDQSAPSVTVVSVNNADDTAYTPGATNWANQNVTVTFSCTDDGPSGVDTLTPNPVTVNAEGSGQSASTTCTDKAGNSANGSQGDINIDKTAPVITPSAKTADDDANYTGAWTNQDVVVSFGCTDALSGVATNGLLGGTVSGEGANQSKSSTGSCTDYAGNSASGASFNGINIDKTAPSVAYTSASPTPNAAGWNKTDVVATFTATDSLSGFLPIGSPTKTGTSTTSGEGASVTVGSPAFTDRAANAAAANTATSDAFKIDKTPPTNAVTGVTNGATYVLGSVPIPGCDTQDQALLSGVKTSATLGVSGGPVGSITATCSGGSDNADNAAPTVSATYTVIYNYSGFFRPIDNLPAYNVVKAGSAIPVKFSLGGNRGLNILAAGYPKWKQIACDPTAPEDGVEETSTAGNSSLSYDAVSDQYVYVWKTDKAWATKCMSLEVKLNDTTSHFANFKFTR